MCCRYNAPVLSPVYNSKFSMIQRMGWGPPELNSLGVEEVCGRRPGRESIPEAHPWRQVSQAPEGQEMLPKNLLPKLLPPLQ